ncbi:MAG TPA: alpha/beta family hydrolase [Candidatus Aquilonibacter sp.]|nr:alpha/beta family hydrolase [Candidatus Aquilonibacter sp.]
MSTTTTPEVFTDITVDPFVRGFLHRPDKANGSGLVLTHGSGGNCNAPILIALAETFAAAGFLVLRCDLPFRQDRPYGPPRPGDAKRDRAGLKNAIVSLKNQNAQRVFLGGHSYGGRQASMLCAEEPTSAAGLLLTSYPLHLPGKTELRIQHLPNLKTPALFVQGTRDPFGSIPEIEQAIKLIPAKTKLVPIEGTGHDLGFKGKAKREELPGKVLAEFGNFFSQV